MLTANPSANFNSAFAASAEDCFDTHLDHYRRLGLVGQGQFAQVYCAVHRRTGQIVALKQTRHIRASASQEAKILPMLNHSNVVNCYAAMHADEGDRFVLEYCESGTLRNYLSSLKPLPLSQAKAFLIDLLKGLSYIHERKIFHGDLKPENILLTYQSKRLVAKLSDFGSACSSNTPHQSQLEIGSPTYAAPERFDGHTSYATDLYAVGVMLYELLLGDRPFSGSPHQLQIAHKEQPIPLPNNLSSSAIHLIKTSLQKDPAKRFKSASAMLFAVQQLSTLYQSATLPSLYGSDAPASAHASVAHAISSIDFSSPVESMISVSEGCCLKAAASLYFLDRQQQRSLLAPLAESDQVAISPDRRWLATFDESSSAYEGSSARSSTSQLGKFYKIQSGSAGGDQARSVVLSAVLSAVINGSENRETTLKILALDNRYLLHISVDRERHTTTLSGYTRRGQFVGQYKLNFVLSRAAIAHSPYQLIACIEGDSELLYSRIVVISLKPFQVRYLPCPSAPRCACATSWGYVVVCQRSFCFFDRDRNLIGQLEHALEISAIAPLTDHQILLSTPQAKPYLQLLELSQLEIDIIF